jgi:hypothetical protein
MYAVSFIARSDDDHPGRGKGKVGKGVDESPKIAPVVTFIHPHCATVCNDAQRWRLDT